MIVITGAYGFIGSNLVAEMERKLTEELVLVDTFGHGDKWKNLSNRRLHIMLEPQQIEGFIRDNHNSISCIIHLGANSSTVEDDVDLLYNNNYRFSTRLLDLCSIYGIRFLYASSASVYGDGKMGFNDSDNILDIQSLKPLNAYGWSKKILDEHCAARGYKNIVGLRFFNVYGPNEYHKGEQASVVFKWYNQIKNSLPIGLYKSYSSGYKDGFQKRDFVFVQDCVDVILWMIHNTAINGIFNVGTGCAHPFIDIVASIENVLRKKAIYSFVDMPDRIRKHYQYYTEADISKLRDSGYNKEMTSLEDGIQTYIKQYLNTNNYR